MKILRWFCGILVAIFTSSAMGERCAIDRVEHHDTGLTIIFHKDVEGELHVVPRLGSSYDYIISKGQALNPENQPISLILKDGTMAYFNGGDVHTGCSFSAVDNSDTSGIEAVNWTNVPGLPGNSTKHFINAENQRRTQ